MCLHVVHSFLQRIRESLNDVFIFFDIAFLCRKSGVGDITGILAERGNYITVSFLLQGGGMGFEFNGEISLPAGKGRCGGTEVYTLVDAPK